MKTSLPCFAQAFKWGWHLQVRFLSCHHSYANSGKKKHNKQLWVPSVQHSTIWISARSGYTLFLLWWWFSESCDFLPLSSIGGDCTLNKRWIWMSSTSSGHGKKKKNIVPSMAPVALELLSFTGRGGEDSGSWRGSLLRRGHKFRSCFASSSEM